MAPGNRGAHRLEARRQIMRAAGQEWEGGLVGSRAEARQERRGIEHFDPGGRQLDGERQAVEPAPDPAAVVDLLSSPRWTVEDRLEILLDPSYAGLAATIPPAAAVIDAAGGALGPGHTWWGESYLQIGGRPVRYTFQTDEQFAASHETYGPNFLDAFLREEYPPTVDGIPLAVRTIVYRFDNEDAARSNFNQIPARLDADAPRDPNFVWFPLEAPAPAETPADPASELPASCSFQSYTATVGTELGVTVAVRNGADIPTLFMGVVGPPCPEEARSSDDPSAQELDVAVEATLGFIEGMQRFAASLKSDYEIAALNPNNPSFGAIAADRARRETLEDCNEPA